MNQAELARGHGDRAARQSLSSFSGALSLQSTGRSLVTTEQHAHSAQQSPMLTSTPSRIPLSAQNRTATLATGSTASSHSMNRDSRAQRQPVQRISPFSSPTHPAVSYSVIPPRLGSPATSYVLNVGRANRSLPYQASSQSHASAYHSDPSWPENPSHAPHSEAWTSSTGPAMRPQYHSHDQQTHPLHPYERAQTSSSGAELVRHDALDPHEPVPGTVVAMADGALPMIQKVLTFWNESRLFRSITRSNPALPISRPSTPSETFGYDAADDIPDLSSSVSVPDRRPVFNGNYSNVYKGVFQGQAVGVKALRTVNENHAMLRKLRREISTWWNLHHDNIVPCLGFIEVEWLGEFGAMISPWYENGSAFSYLSQNPSPLRRVQILLGVATGLLYLHNSDPMIVHGDLKLGNILIDDDYNARLCDFGLVRLIPRDGKHTGMTTTSGHNGTARYLAFELVENDLPPTTASDVHALACVGMQLLYSQPPYAHIQNQVSNAAYKVWREIGSGVPPARRPKGLNGVMSEFWDLLESCWNIQPQKRPSTDKVVKFWEHHGSNIAKYYDITQTPRFGVVKVCSLSEFLCGRLVTLRQVLAIRRWDTVVQ